MAGCSACRPFGTRKQQGVWLNRRHKAIIEPGLHIRPGLTVMRTSLAKLRQPSRATVQADDDLALFYKGKKFLGSLKKKMISKNIFLFLQRIFRFRQLGSCRLESRARHPTIPEFSKTESDRTSTASARVRRLDCRGERLLLRVKLECGATQVNGRICPRAVSRTAASDSTRKESNLSCKIDTGICNQRSKSPTAG
jgi:hypothetical protein